MLERCDCCGAYPEDGGLACEGVPERYEEPINHRNQRNENRANEPEVAYEFV